MVPMREISILDTTLRDGLQHEEHYMSLEKRMQLLNGLVEAGVKKIEAGSFAHPGYLPQFREIDKFAMSLPRDNGVEYTFLALNRRAVERAIRLKAQGAPVHRILTGQIATSASYARKNMNRTQEELFREAADLVKLLHENGITRVAANVGTIFGCPIEGEMPLEKAYDFVARLLDMGFDEIEHSDPDGAASPDRMAEYCAEIMRRWPDPRIHVLHVHDIHGMGIASYYAALEQGIRQFECSLGGTGGQPANRMDGVPIHGTGDYYFSQGPTGLVCTEDFADMLRRMSCSTGLDTEKLISVGCLAEKLFSRTLDSYIVAGHRALDFVRPAAGSSG